MKEIEEANKGRSGVPNKLLRLTTYPTDPVVSSYDDRTLRRRPELPDFSLSLSPGVLVNFTASNVCRYYPITAQRVT